jgi:hypothetical protein
LRRCEEAARMEQLALSSPGTTAATASVRARCEALRRLHARPRHSGRPSAANHSPADTEPADVLDGLHEPGEPRKIVTLAMLRNPADSQFSARLRNRRNSRIIPHRMERCGYVAVHNDNAKSDGLWVILGKRHVIYGRTDLPLRDRVRLAQLFFEEFRHGV